MRAWFCLKLVELKPSLDSIRPSYIIPKVKFILAKLIIIWPTKVEINSEIEYKKASKQIWTLLTSNSFIQVLLFPYRKLPPVSHKINAVCWGLPPLFAICDFNTQFFTIMKSGKKNETLFLPQIQRPPHDVRRFGSTASPIMHAIFASPILLPSKSNTKFTTVCCRTRSEGNRGDTEEHIPSLGLLSQGYCLILIPG